MSIKEMLDGYHVDLLLELMRNYGLPKPASKKAAVAALAAWYADGAWVAGAIAGLDSAELHAITRLTQLGGSTRSTRLAHVLAEDGVLPPLVLDSRSGQPAPLPGSPDEREDRRFADLLAALAVKGLALTHTAVEPSTQKIKWVPGSTVFIPSEVARHIEANALADLPNIGRIEPDYTRSGSVVNSQRDINNYVRTVRRAGSFKMTTAGLLYKTALKQVAEAVEGPSDLGRGKAEGENLYLLFLRRLLGRQQLINYNFETLSASDATHPFWGLNSAERIKATYTVWRDTTAWNGPRMLPSYQRGVELTAQAHPELIPARKIVLNHITQLGSGWISLVGLTNRIEQEDYGFLFPDRDIEPSHFGYYLARGKYQRSPYAPSNNPQFMGFDETIRDEADGWERVEAAYIAHLIAGPLYWLGLVDLGYAGPPLDDATGTKPFAGYRLTPHGEWLLGLRDQPAVEADSGGGIILQPNFEILAMAPIAVETLMMLDAFATVKDSQQNVTTYELTRESVYRGQQGRWQVADIKAFFAQHSRIPLPDNVRRTLDEWDGLYNRIKVHRKVSVAEVATGEIAAALAELDDMQQVTETVLVNHQPLAKVTNAVRAAGYLPLQTREGDRSASNSVQVADDGLVTFAHPVPSIFAKQLLADISVELNDTQRQLLPSLVRSHTLDGAYFAEFFGRIKRLNHGELSLTLINNLKAWANYYGDAKQAQLILTEFKDADTLRELLDDPELGDYLTPLKGVNRPLAVVALEHQERVNTMLKARGITIIEGIS